MGYGKLPNVKEAFETYRKMPHGELWSRAKAKLERMGYRIISRDDAPGWIKSVGEPDIIAVKGDEYVLIEVKPSDQLKRYSKTRAKLILVTDVDEGKAIEVWGLKELEL
jgi:Holliday junction resolvase